MNQLELFPTYSDNRIDNLAKALKMESVWSPTTIDKLEKAGRMFKVSCQKVLECFERVIENECSINSTSS